LEDGIKDPLDAFAHIAAGEHDDVAVTTNHTYISRDLQVLAATPGPSVPGSVPSTPPNGLFLSSLSFMWTQNSPRAKEIEKPCSGTPYPKIISPSEPHNLHQRSAVVYLSALEENW
jgi:hypothetical protein